MRIGYDLHGVIDANPDLYRFMMTVHRLNGDKVFVISGPPTWQIEDQLRDVGIDQGEAYDEVLSVVDYLLEQGLDHKIDEGGDYWFDEKAWWRSKSEICRDHMIEVLYDNEERYQEHFDENHPTRFVLTKWLPRMIKAIVR